MDKEALAEILGVEELTDEQFEKFKKAHESELDKARNQASQTAAKNAEKKAKGEFAKTLEEKAAEKAKSMLEALTQSEEEKLEAQRQELEEARKVLETEKKRTAVEAKFKAAGYEDEALEKFVNTFSVHDDVDSCVSAVDTFLETVNSTIETKVDTIKAELTSTGNVAGVHQGQTTPTVNEGKVVTDIYKKVNEDGFANTRQDNMNLDAHAVQAVLDLGAAQSSDD